MTQSKKISMKRYGEALRRHMEDAGMTQEDLAKKLGTTDNAPYNWLYGHSRPSRDNHDAIAKIFPTMPRLYKLFARPNGITMDRPSGMSLPTPKVAKKVRAPQVKKQVEIDFHAPVPSALALTLDERHFIQQAKKIGFDAAKALIDFAKSRLTQ